jgi:hypothetical protein
MPYCSHCGAQLPDGAPACPQCAVTRPGPIVREAAADKPSGALAVLAFLFPVVGFALWFAWRQPSPLRARSVRRAAVWGVVVGGIATVVAFAVYMAVIVSVMKKLS